VTPYQLPHRVTPTLVTPLGPLDRRNIGHEFELNQTSL